MKRKKNEMRIALCQMRVEENKANNLQKAREMLRRSAEAQAELAILPEMFNCPYDRAYFTAYAEPETGETLSMLSAAAKVEGIWIVGGTIPQFSADRRIYNTCSVLNSQGQVVADYQKIHLFDVDLGDEARFTESATFAPGHKVVVFTCGRVRIGLGICYDLRFPELSRLLSLRGADLIIFPSAFTRVTGEAHWELLLRARAVDNQVFIAGVSSAPNPEVSFQAYGHSMVVDPWGKVEASLGDEEEILIVDIDLEKVARIRRELPLLAHRRTDLYRVSECWRFQGGEDGND